MLERKDVVNGLLSLYRRPSYLEIGVSAGETFRAVKAARKVAVDPEFLFDVEAARRDDPRAEFHRATSDRYFEQVAGAGEGFDVVFLDGLHTFEQTLRDLTNAMAALRPRGVIVIDDVLPSSEIAALRNVAEAFARRDAGEAWDGSWMGDVYRLVPFVDTFLPAWSYRCVADTLGQLVLWRGRRPAGPDQLLADICALPFGAIEMRRDRWRLAPFAAIRAEVAASVRPRTRST